MHAGSKNRLWILRETYVLLTTGRVCYSHNRRLVGCEMHSRRMNFVLVSDVQNVASYVPICSSTAEQLGRHHEMHIGWPCLATHGKIIHCALRHECVNALVVSFKTFQQFFSVPDSNSTALCESPPCRPPDELCDSLAFRLCKRL
jgi:hypothetical protein